MDFILIVSLSITIGGQTIERLDDLSVEESFRETLDDNFSYEYSEWLAGRFASDVRGMVRPIGGAIVNPPIETPTIEDLWDAGPEAFVAFDPAELGVMMEGADGTRVFVAPSWYDATETPTYSGFDHDRVGWPDWTDMSSWFTPGSLGWSVESIEDANLRDSCNAARALASRSFLVRVPVLVVSNDRFLHVDELYHRSTSFVIAHFQESFFDAPKRRCPSCVEVEPIPPTVMEAVKDLEPFHPEIIDSTAYDLMVTWDSPATWDQYGDLWPISRWVEAIGATSRDEAARLTSMAGLCLDPTMLTGMRMALVPPEWGGVASSMPSIPPELLLRFVDFRYFDELVASDMMDDVANSPWIWGSWTYIRDHCSGCETWEDWFFGSEDKDLSPHWYLPGDRSMRDMRHTFALRGFLTDEQARERHGAAWIEPPTTDTMDRWWCEDQVNANGIADRWMGISASDDSECGW